MIVLHRFLRIWPMYISTLLFFWVLIPLGGNGPIFFQYYRTQSSYCEKYWWSHLLFINNIYPWTGEEDCMGWTWYLPNDMQFFFISPPIIYLFYHRRRLALFIVGFIQLACYTINIVITATYAFSPSYLRVKTNYF
jgi:peptidoglycan/LPS O-acetylase OafA/YrhL